VRAGGNTLNHNETIAVRSSVRAGAIDPNHNEHVAG
jgi:hypothetical protein